MRSNDVLYSTDSSKFLKLLRSGASLSAMCAMGLAAPAYAQTAPAAGQGTAGAATVPTSDTGGTGLQANDAAQGPEIVVTGIRQSLANAQAVKRNSDTVVDAISATDIGALPDRSVTEALQRVPGIAINRFQGSNDPDHFSAEGSGVTVRGLNFVRSEFNGRDAFAAGVGGQALNFSDVPAELLGSVEIYKNSTAENIEGGLAGTVNLNTRKPFDDKGLHIAFDAEGSYGDLEKKWTPTGSLLVSNTWNTGIGRIGLLADLSYSELKYRSDGIQVTNFQTRDNQIAIAANSSATLVCRNPLPGDSDATTLAPGAACGAAGTGGPDGLLDAAGTRYAPLGAQFRSQDYDRTRNGQAIAAQWQSNDGRTTLTAQFLRSATELKWGEHTFETAPDLSEYDTYPLGCQWNTDGPNNTTRAKCPVGATQNYTYDANGLFQKGYITTPGGGYRNTNSLVPFGGQQQSLSRRQVDEHTTNNDWGLNLKAQPTDHLFLNFDGDYTKSHHRQLDVSMLGSTFADEYLDLTGNLPQAVPHKPNQLQAIYTWGTGPTPDAQMASESDAQYFADPRVQFWRAAMDHIEDSVGNEYAFKMDADRKFDSGFLSDIKFGARYADRGETVKYSTYNWGALSEVWSGSGPVSINQLGGANAGLYSFDNFFRGQTSAPPSAYYYTGDLIGGYNQFVQFAQQVSDAWKAGGSTASTFNAAANRPGVVPGSGGYLPNEIQDVQQRNVDFYVQANFRSENVFGVRMTGNLGLRYVNTAVRSAGSIFITAQSLGVDQTYASRCTPMPPPEAPPGAIIAQQGGICLLGENGFNQLQTFAGVQTITDPLTGAQSVVAVPGAATATPNTANTSDNHFLPSLNLKFELSRTLIARFAASRVMTLPDLASVRNAFSASYGTDNVVTFSLGNPYLKPATATQLDATLEWYFGRVGSLTFDVFYKDIKNFFYASTVTRSFTQNGVTVPVAVRIADNYSGHGKIKGAEVAWQQTFNFLPSFLSGLGVNASYTYLDSSGLPNSFLNTGVAANLGNFVTSNGHLPLEQLSKHTVNAEVFYEKGPISLRAAYNWRSRFLLTAADVIFPYAPIFQAPYGQLDASAFININKQLKLGVQGVNLTDSVTKTEQAYTGDPTMLAPRSYFLTDRRFSIILRGSF